MYKCCFWYDCTNVVTEYINVDTKYIVCTCTYVITEYKYVSLNIHIFWHWKYKWHYWIYKYCYWIYMNKCCYWIYKCCQWIYIHIHVCCYWIYKYTCTVKFCYFQEHKTPQKMTNTNTDTNIHELLISKSIILKIQCVPDLVSSLVLNTIFCWFLCSFDAQKNGESSSIQEDWSPQVLMRPQY